MESIPQVCEAFPTEYYIFEDKLVKVEETSNGFLASYVYDKTSKQFVKDMSYMSQMYYEDNFNTAKKMFRISQEDFESKLKYYNQ
jgi:hypothetical protein